MAAPVNDPGLALTSVRNTVTDTAHKVSNSYQTYVSNPYPLYI